MKIISCLNAMVTSQSRRHVSTNIEKYFATVRYNWYTDEYLDCAGTSRPSVMDVDAVYRGGHRGITCSRWLERWSLYLERSLSLVEIPVRLYQCSTLYNVDRIVYRIGLDI